jgi:hypothetical protein
MDKKLIKEDISNMKFLMGYKPGKLISEQDQLQDEDEFLMDKVIKMDEEFDNDPLYRKYEKIYLKKEIGGSAMFGFEEIPDEMLDMFMSMGKELKPEGGMTPEMIIQGKDKTIEHTTKVMEMAAQDNEFDLAIRLREFITLLKKL